MNRKKRKYDTPAYKRDRRLARWEMMLCYDCPNDTDSIHSFCQDCLRKRRLHRIRRQKESK